MAHENKAQSQDYRRFYLSMVGCITFLFTMFLSFEFGAFSFKWFGSLVFWNLIILISFMYSREVNKK